MSVKQSLLDRYHSAGWIGRFLFATWLAATLNFADVLQRTVKAASAAGKYTTPDGFTIIICYFGPPVGFYPRLLVFVSLAIAIVGLFRQTFPPSLGSFPGLMAALSTYIYWWHASYRVFRNFDDVDIHFLHNPEIRQVAYLYQGSWLDVCIASSVVVCFVLVGDRLLNRQEFAVQ